jgi:hypothetical protein
MGSKKKAKKKIVIVKPKRIMNFKVTEKERKEIKALAKKHCEGNTTKLIKLALTRLK